jgi:transcriptional regulator with XRE-family HTH domain
MSFAARLKSERDRLGLSQAEAARWLDCGKRTLEHWESGDREPLAVTQEGVMARLKAIDSHLAHSGFRCPKCGGRTFGREIRSANPLKVGRYECHDEKGVGCKWKGQNDKLTHGSRASDVSKTQNRERG